MIVEVLLLKLPLLLYIGLEENLDIEAVEVVENDELAEIEKDLLRSTVGKKPGPKVACVAEAGAGTTEVVIEERDWEAA